MQGCATPLNADPLGSVGRENSDVTTLLRVLLAVSLWPLLAAGTSAAHNACEPAPPGFDVVLQTDNSLFGPARRFRVPQRARLVRVLGQGPLVSQRSSAVRQKLRLPAYDDRRLRHRGTERVLRHRDFGGGPHPKRRVRVHVTETVPGQNCICTQAFVNPIVAVSIPFRTRRVDFAHTESQLRCDAIGPMGEADRPLPNKPLQMTSRSVLKVGAPDPRLRRARGSRRLAAHARGILRLNQRRSTMSGRTVRQRGLCVRRPRQSWRLPGWSRSDCDAHLSGRPSPPELAADRPELRVVEGAGITCRPWWHSTLRPA